MIIVLTTVPDLAMAEKIARTLVADQLAACVHILPAHQSVYRWEGKVAVDTEYTLLIKTIEERFAAVEAAILALHSYQLPAIIKTPVTGGTEKYLAWVVENTQTV